MNITSVHMFSVVFMLSWFLCAKPAFAGSKGDWMKLLSDTLPVCKLSTLVLMTVVLFMVVVC